MLFKKTYSMLIGICVLNLSAPDLESTEMSSDNNLSHSQRNHCLQDAIDAITDKVKRRGDLSYVSVERQLELIDFLTDFGLGRFLLERGGLNGYWTDYAIKHPVKGRLTGLNDENKPLNTLEDFLLNQAPTVLATQQRFTIFREEIQKRVQEGASLASIPCGLMADLLELDFTNVSHISLTGIDLDPASIEYAKQAAKRLNLSNQCQFFQCDAWDLNIRAAFDLITSNGLAIYEPDDEKVTQLYRGFFEALKPGGYLVTSFLTPPPVPGLQSEWKLDAVNMQDALLQKIVFADILACAWQVFRSEETVKSQLKTAGFDQIEIIYDKAHIFPTIIARKPI
jgi:SAM-dependent methyltransferase